MIQNIDCSDINKQIVFSNQKHNSSKCKFQWCGNMDSFDNVIIHKKTHTKKGAP